MIDRRELTVHGRAELAYERELGEDKAATQRELAKRFWSCCAEPKDAPHHPACHLFVPDEQPAVIDGQEALL